jgi:cytochrome c-type biogenesis protein CcmH
MIAFFVVALLMVVGTLLFLVPPLIGKRARVTDVSRSDANLSIHRDQFTELDGDLAAGVIDRRQYASAKRELDLRVIEEVEQAADRSAGDCKNKWSLAGALALFIPLATLATYLALGTPSALDVAHSQRQAERGAHELTPQRLEAMVNQLKERLQAMPEDPEESAYAYRQAVRLMPNDAQLLADFADTLAMAQGRSLAGEPEQLIERALKTDSRNVKALALGGTAAFGRGDYAQASMLWRRVLELVPPGSELAQRIQVSVAESENRRSAKPASVGAPANRPVRAAEAK